LNASRSLVRALADAVPRNALALLALLAVAVFASSWGCIALLVHSGRIATIWISNAIVLTVLLKQPRRFWPSILAVAFFAGVAADLVAGDVLFRAVGLTLTNTVEMLVVAWPLRRLGFDRNFSAIEALLTFYGLVIAACCVSALLAAATLNISTGVAILPAAATWFGADALGLSLLVPFFMCVRPAALAQILSAGQRGQTLLLLAMVPAVVVLCILFPTWTPSFFYFPVLILLTFRRGFAGGALGLLVALLLSFALVIGGHPSHSLVLHSAAARIAMIQLYFSVIGFTLILTGAALEERRKLERSLTVAVGRAETSREEAVLAKEVAERASQTKSAFLANMSHELRTPLNAVLGFSEIIAGEMYGPSGDARYRDYAGLIHSAGRHLLDLISDILDMSKIEAGKAELDRRQIDPAALVQECASLMSERAASAGVELHVDLAAAPRMLCADRRAAKQILLNLLSNAVKFTPRGGLVGVEVDEDDGHCRFTVRDTGIGIPAAQIGRLGNPFVQLANSGQQAGTGLGLALVRGLADLHGGTFRISSIEGQGTRVTVGLPLDAPSADAVAA
jgi:signal transduction histidine kinase